MAFEEKPTPPQKSDEERYVSTEEREQLRVNAMTPEEFDKFKKEEKARLLITEAFSGLKNPELKEIYDTLFKTFIKSARGILKRVKKDLSYRRGNADDPSSDDRLVGPLAQTDLLELRMIENRIKDFEAYSKNPNANSQLMAGYFINAAKGFDDMGVGKKIGYDLWNVVSPLCKELEKRVRSGLTPMGNANLVLDDLSRISSLFDL